MPIADCRLPIKAGEIYNFVKMAFLARKITKLQNFAENYKEIS
jgi:hypothetical protein